MARGLDPARSSAAAHGGPPTGRAPEPIAWIVLGAHQLHREDVRRAALHAAPHPDRGAARASAPPRHRDPGPVQIPAARVGAEPGVQGQRAGLVLGTGHALEGAGEAVVGGV